MKFQHDQIVKEGADLGIILCAGERSFDVVWIGGSTSRYRYSTGRDVRGATALDLDGQARLVEHLKKEVAEARRERRTGARIKRGQVWPSR